MTRLGQLIVEWLDTQQFPPSNAKLAHQVGVSPQTLINWRTEVKRVPDVANLRALARVTRIPYEEILDAALRDAKYLKTEDLPQTMAARKGRRQPTAADVLDMSGEESQDTDS